MQRWCADASAGIIQAKSLIVSEDEVINALNQARGNPSTIMHTQRGYNMRYNKFSLVLKESVSSGLVIDLPSRIVQHDGYMQIGTEVPDLSEDQKVLQAMNTAKRLKKSSKGSRFKYSDVDGELEFYTPWNQEPAQFYTD